jgi:hypothetical protein
MLLLASSVFSSCLNIDLSFASVKFNSCSCNCICLECIGGASFFS